MVSLTGYYHSDSDYARPSLCPAPGSIVSSDTAQDEEAALLTSSHGTAQVEPTGPSCPKAVCGRSSAGPRGPSEAGIL